MKILLISSLYPPLMLGGAEDSARNWAQWLAAAGHDVSVIRTADRGEAPGTVTGDDGVRVHVVATGHVYPAFRFPEAPGWQKPLWHVQDHVGRSANAAVGAILDREQPDIVNIHLVQGLGYAVLSEIAKRRLPVAFTLHDLGLACIRMSMFRNGQECMQQCTACRLSSRYKLRLVREQARIGFVSPSRANLDRLARYFPVFDYPAVAMLNPNAYPAPRVRHEPAPTLRLLFAGKLHETKGVDILMAAVADLATRHAVSLTVAGKGPLEEELHRLYGAQPWCRFVGFVSQQELADHMAQSDLFCIPSIWAENSPGVVVQALGVGLPVMGSARGGIPELVQDQVNGALLSDTTVDGWRTALEAVLADRAMLARWRDSATAHAADFGQDALARRLLEWMRTLVSGQVAEPAGSVAGDAPLHG